MNDEISRPSTYSRKEFLNLTGSALALGALASGTRAAGAEPAAPGLKPADDLCYASARELARAIRTRQVSAREVMSAHLAGIARWNPKINAIVAKLDDDQCLSLADEADQRLARGGPVGPLHGLPFAFKDTEDAVGFPNTHGSLIYRNTRPTTDSVVVERIRRAGVIPIGKTNVPEFAMGSNTYNRVYGTTLNPYDLTKSAGGSSGGAAAALAAGLVPLANGSDLAGSLRNPGNFNNIVGFRPSVGLVPLAPVAMPFLGHVVKGPLARNVADTAFLLSIMAGPDPRDPGSYPSDPALFGQALDRDFKGARVAWCPDLGGLPLDGRVRAVLETQRTALERLGCIVENACPDLSEANELFLTLRRWVSWNTMSEVLGAHRDLIKPEAIEEIEQGRSITSEQVAQAMMAQGRLMQRMRIFQQKYEFVACAVNQVPPFPPGVHWPKEIEGERMEHYIAWMKSAYWISATFCPAISVPAGFTSDGLPVGLQIVGRYRADFAVLQMAHAFEQATKVGLRHPSIPL